MATCLVWPGLPFFFAYRFQFYIFNQNRTTNNKIQLLFSLHLAREVPTVRTSREAEQAEALCSLFLSLPPADILRPYGNIWTYDKEVRQYEASGIDFFAAAGSNPSVRKYRVPM